ncbi:hypothetical protein ACQPW1_22455 [Nocardia sp. CA-128927]|uniref:hypothetical protein n=1 Tax=Nocardia sp. CA-128927 TaxID=3239975 RepID=UPI003D9822AB
MTGPELPAYEAQIAQQQARLLRQIQHLAGEHTRITGLGYEGYDSTDGDPRAEWSAHLDGLTAEREAAETAAFEAGVPQVSIEDTRELGFRMGRPARQGEQGAPSVPLPNEASSFLVDMLRVELAHLQRMAMLAAAVQDRIVTGRSTIPLDPAAWAHMQANMAVKYQRATALANAAGLTAAEGRHLWDLDSPTWEHMHASTVATYSEAQLVAQWRTVARPSPEMPLPPYVGVGLDGAPLTQAEALPPTPQEMISHAAAAIRTDFIDMAIDPEGQISAAIDAALPADNGENRGSDPAGATLMNGASETQLDSDPQPHPDGGPEP